MEEVLLQIQQQLLEIKKQLDENKQEAFLSLKEAAAYLHMSPSCLYKKTANNSIPHYKPGGKTLLFKKAELDQLVSGARVPTQKELTSTTFKDLSNEKPTQHP